MSLCTTHDLLVARYALIIRKANRSAQFVQLDVYLVCLIVTSPIRTAAMRK